MEVCSPHGIKPILWAGGLIGWSFNEQMLPWDDDLDVLITEDDVPKLKQLNNSNTNSLLIDG